MQPIPINLLKKGSPLLEEKGKNSEIVNPLVTIEKDTEKVAFDQLENIPCILEPYKRIPSKFRVSDSRKRQDTPKPEYFNQFDPARKDSIGLIPQIIEPSPIITNKQAKFQLPLSNLPRYGTPTRPDEDQIANVGKKSKVMFKSLSTGTIPTTYRTKNRERRDSHLYSLTSTRRSDLRIYYPKIEFSALDQRLRFLKSIKLDKVTKSQDKFNAGVKSYLKKKIEENGASFKGISVQNLDKKLEAISRSEIYDLIKAQETTHEGKPLTASPRLLGELVEIIQSSGLLLDTFIKRFIILRQELIEYQINKNQFSDWTIQLGTVLDRLIKPTFYEGKYHGVTIGKNLEEFLNIADEVMNKTYGMKIYKIIRLVFGENESERKAILDYLRLWINPNNKVMEDLKQRLTVWRQNSTDLANLNKWGHSWQQNHDEQQNLREIRIYEIIRCLCNEDNGLTIIPESLRIGNTNEKGEVDFHLLQKGTFSTRNQFFESFCEELYKAGLSDTLIRKEQVMSDVSLLLVGDGRDRSTLFLQLKRKLTPLIIMRMIEHFKEKANPKGCVSQLSIVDLCQLVGQVQPDIISLIKDFGVKNDEEKSLVEGMILPDVLTSIQLLFKASHSKDVNIEEVVAHRVLSIAKEDVQSCVEKFCFTKDGLHRQFIATIIPAVHSLVAEFIAESNRPKATMTLDSKCEKELIPCDTEESGVIAKEELNAKLMQGVNLKEILNSGIVEQSFIEKLSKEELLYMITQDSSSLLSSVGYTKSELDSVLSVAILPQIIVDVKSKLAFSIMKKGVLGFILREKILKKVTENIRTLLESMKFDKDKIELFLSSRLSPKIELKVLSMIDHKVKATLGLKNTVLPVVIQEIFSYMQNCKIDQLNLYQ